MFHDECSFQILTKKLYLLKDVIVKKFREVFGVAVVYANAVTTVPIGLAFRHLHCRSSIFGDLILSVEVDFVTIFLHVFKGVFFRNRIEVVLDYSKAHCMTLERAKY